MNKIKKYTKHISLISLGIIPAATLISCTTTTVVKEKEKVTTSTTSNEKSKIGFWNVLNDGGKQSYKNEALAKVIKHIDTDIMGLAEIDSPTAVTALVAQLGSDWSSVVSKKKAAGLGGANQAEYYAFIYKTKKYEPVKFKGTNTIGAIYDNPEVTNELVPGTKTNFVRPPFGVEFRYKKTGHNFTFFISHNDSPGVSKSKGKITEKSTKGQGTQEIWEAKHTVDVAKWFDSIDGNNNDLVYMADTNIHTTNGDVPFNTLTSAKFESMLNSKTSITSLGTGIGHYTNAYDKIFSNSSFIKPNKASSGFYPLYDVYKDGVIDQTKFEAKINAARPGKPYQNNIRSGISDHSPVFTELDFSVTDTDGGTVSGSSFNKAKTSNPQSQGIDINGGDLSNLSAIKGVGQSVVDAILKYRSLVGPIKNEAILDRIIYSGNSRMSIAKIRALSPKITFNFGSTVVKDSSFHKTNLNSATSIQLQSELKLSEFYAKRIIAYRSNTGRITKQLLETTILKKKLDMIEWYGDDNAQTPIVKDQNFATKKNINKLNAADFTKFGFNANDATAISDALDQIAQTNGGNGISSFSDFDKPLAQNTFLLNSVKVQLPFFTKIDPADKARKATAVQKQNIGTIAGLAKDEPDFVAKLLAAGAAPKAASHGGTSGIGHISNGMMKNIYNWLKANPGPISIADLVKKPLQKTKTKTKLYSTSSVKKIEDAFPSTIFE